mmetsp:Transcript_13720/g.34547  ORF Transcript_13720/g.34547 Transcript_13720/m.34547 type:complete len:159 (-) Transcript_13720:53-529(-)
MGGMGGMGGMGARRTYYYSTGGRARQHRARGQEAGGDQTPLQFNLAALIQLAPILFLILFTVLGNSPSEPVYSLRAGGSYRTMERTANKDVDFYVKSHSAFMREFPEGSYARRKLELGIEREFREYLEGECWRERLQQTASGADLPMNACQRIKDLWG